MSLKSIKSLILIIAYVIANNSILSEQQRFLISKRLGGEYMMIYGFEWVKDIDRQRQYVHKEPKENIYTPITEKVIYGFEWVKDTNSQKQFSKRVLPKTLIYSNDKYKALDDKVRSYNINYSLMSALEKYGTEPDNLRDVENAFNKKQYINNKYEETENGKVFEEKLNHVIKNVKIV